MVIELRSSGISLAPRGVPTWSGRNVGTVAIPDPSLRSGRYKRAKFTVLPYFTGTCATRFAGYELFSPITPRSVPISSGLHVGLQIFRCFAAGILTLSRFDTPSKWQGYVPLRGNNH